ncbi:hypothetical protein AB0M11_03645 [Streptomyces sp. NPDC051987]|uniref:hypothetical protein n=1 Tax=Streptomyces sp. NPDC051987 TaxID=3155808 RepID=UPI003433C2D4
MRVVRTVPGRRALHLALLVGGLLALGFLCGQQAQAAERGSATPSSASLVTQKAAPPGVVASDRVPGAARKPGAEPVPVTDGVHDLVGSVTGTVGDTVTVTATVTKTLTETATETVVSPVVSVLTDTLAETVRQVTQLPGVPVVQLPVPPVVSEPPAEPAPVTPAPGPARGQAQPRTLVTHDTGHEKSRTPAERKTAATTAVSYGPRIAVAPVPPAAATRSGGHRADRADRAVDAPAHPAPIGDPDGVLGKSAVDGGSSRHGDAHAVTFAGRAPFGLAPGAAARADAAGTRDRHGDIPVFPG